MIKYWLYSSILNVWIVLNKLFKIKVKKNYKRTRSLNVYVYLVLNNASLYQFNLSYYDILNA